VARLEANLHRVVPASPQQDLRALSRSGLRSYFRYWCDVFRLPEWDEARTVGTVVVEGEHHLREAMDAGAGFVAALPHMGNWDHVGAWASLTGVPVSTVAERLKPESLFDRFLAVRRGLGIEVLPLTGGPGNLIGELAQRLRQGRAVCLLADRDLRATGIPVPFFGGLARMPAGPALLAQLTGAPLHPVSTTYDMGDGTPGEHRLHVRIDPAVPVPAEGSTRDKTTAMTEELARVFERHIAAAPQDWHMLQQLWA
jgi:lauroyl/myristoyl acyltransferase